MTHKDANVYGCMYTVNPPVKFFDVFCRAPAIPGYYSCNAIINIIFCLGCCDDATFNMPMNINKSRGYYQTFCVNYFVSTEGKVFSYPGDLSIFNGYISIKPGISGSINYPTIFY